MRAFEKIIAQPLPPLNPGVLWLNTSKNPAILCHFRDIAAFEESKHKPKGQKK